MNDILKWVTMSRRGEMKWRDRDRENEVSGRSFGS